MPKPFKLAIVRGRHDGNVGTIPDQACLAMLMTGPYSVLRFWSDTTGGYFDFLDSAMMPWVDMTIDPAATDRASQARAAFAALRAANPGHDPLAGFDGALVITHPGRITVNMQVVNFDGGSTGIDGLPVSVIPVMASDHTFICHELGHTLGFEHTFGLDNNGTDWNPGDADVIVGPEYGSPYDLMSSAAFGSRWLGTGPFYSASPVFAGPAVPDWPYAGATAMGPHLSRANLHRWFPEALEPGHVAHRPFPVPGEVRHVRLSAAGGRSGTSLLVLHPPGEPESGIGRVYVEYRGTRGWDRGMKVFGADLARAGVVVHTLEEVAGAGPRVWYRGSVAAGSIDTDLEVATKPVVIILEGYEDAEGEGWADISYRAAAERALAITPANARDDIVGGQVIRDERTPCGDRVLYGSWSTQSFCQFRVSTTGFGGASASPPTIAWTVAGTALAPGQGTVTVPFDGAEFTLEYVIDPVSFELGLTSRGGEKLSAPLAATATEAGGGASASASATFDALGYFEGYPPEDASRLFACLAGIADAHRIPLPWLFRRPDPDPAFGVDVGAWQEMALGRIDQLRLDAATAGALADIVRLQRPG